MKQVQPELEKLKFVIGLSGTYWDKIPSYSIWIDDTLIRKDYVAYDSDVVELIEFNYNCKIDSDHVLKIRLENKHYTDTVLDENNIIVRDMLLNIDSISIDDIELDFLKWSISDYTPDSKEFPKLNNCVNLGWNGSYIIQFKSPFYLWLLENM